MGHVFRELRQDSLMTFVGEPASEQAAKDYRECLNFGNEVGKKEQDADDEEDPLKFRCMLSPLGQYDVTALIELWRGRDIDD